MATTVIANTTMEGSYIPLTKEKSTHERVMATTMSVDEYFDELIAQVREDYASL